MAGEALEKMKESIAFDKRALSSLACMAGVLVLLLLYPLRSMSYAGFVPVALLVTWLIYSFMAPVALLTRRGFLSQTTTKRSKIRRALWNSSFVHVRVAFCSIIAAAIVLMAVSGFDFIDWILVFVSLPVLLLIVSGVRRQAAGEVAENYEYWVAVRISIWLMLLFLATILAIYKFFLAEVPYYINLSIIEATTESFTSIRSEAATREVGWLLGVNEAVNTAAWHLMQTASQAKGSSALKVVGWLIFLFLDALRVGAVLVMLGGVLILTDSFLRSGKRPLGDTVFARSFTFTMLALFAGYFLLTQVDVSRFIADTKERALQSATHLFDPCADRQLAAQEEFQSEMGIALSDAELEAHERMRDEIDEQVERLFSAAEAGVDTFLDWNFSLVGQYQQLAYIGASAAGNSFSDYISRQIDRHIAIAVSAEESELDNALMAAYVAEVERIKARHASARMGLAETVECLTLPEPALTGESFMNKSLVGAGSGAGAGVIALRGGIRVGANAVGKTGVKRVLASIVAKLSAKAATSTSAGAVGMFCGPAVVVCGPVFAGATWVGTDLVINRIDEALNRQSMKEGILTSISEEKERLKRAYTEMYQRALTEVVEEIEESQQRAFNPKRDGVG